MGSFEIAAWQKSKKWLKLMKAQRNRLKIQKDQP